MKQRVAILTAAVGTVLAAPMLMTATANADVWQPVPGISIPLPDGVFRGCPASSPPRLPDPRTPRANPVRATVTGCISTAAMPPTTAPIGCAPTCDTVRVRPAGGSGRRPAGIHSMMVGWLSG